MRLKKFIAYILSLIMIVTLVVVELNGDTLKVNAQSMHNKKACWVSYQDVYNELRDKEKAEYEEKIWKNKDC